MHRAPFGNNFSRSLVVGIGGLMLTSSHKVPVHSVIFGMASIYVPESVLLASSPSQLDGLQINSAITLLAKGLRLAVLFYIFITLLPI